MNCIHNCRDQSYILNMNYPCEWRDTFSSWVAVFFHLHGHVIKGSIGTQFSPSHQGLYFPTSKDWCFTSELFLLGQMPARADESSFVHRVFLPISRNLYDLIHFHSHWKLSPPLPVPPLSHVLLFSSTLSVIGSLLLFRLIHRWDKIYLVPPHPLSLAFKFSPLPSDPPLGCKSLVIFHPLSQPLKVSSSSTCSTEKSPLQIQCGGLTVPYNTYHHQKALHRTCCG